MFYEKILRPLLFRFTDPEQIHHFTIKGLGITSRIKPVYLLLHKYLANTDPIINVRLGNLSLPSPVGLAAGFDKKIDAPLSYAMLGFGFAELGSISFSEQAGNAKPRLWRLPKDSGLIVYYGLSNLGAIKSAAKLKKIKNRPIPYGASIAPTTGLELSQMAEDYLKTLEQVHSFSDYITLNVSCPNVAKCDAFSQISFIEELIEKTRQKIDALNIKKDVFIKVGPHHSKEDLSKIISACINNNFTGIIATNLIKNRRELRSNSSEKELSHPGGISGKLLQDQSDAVISQIFKESQGKLKIVGVGGIFTAEDAYKKIKLGASALQLITGFIYGGPLTLWRINRNLIKLLKKDGYTNISEAVGKDS